MRRLVALLMLLWPGVGLAQSFDAAELQRILRHGPWPPAWAPDPSNRVSGIPAAIELGRRLFFDPRLSSSSAVSCATCHPPDRHWADGVPRSTGLELVDRNAISLVNVRWQRWFGWDGASDSLWAQSIRPLLDKREMATGPEQVAALLRGDRDLACRYRHAFGAAPPTDGRSALVDAAKAMAAFQETLVTGRTSFDQFRDALARGDEAQAARYPAPARRGLKLFVGRGGCALCHVGPGFTNGEFHDTGISFFIRPEKVDPGRHAGIQRLRESPYNLLGAYNDDPRRSTATRTRHVALQHRIWGEFRVPGLRNVALTAPYMHNGSLASLRDVVRHYSEVDEDRLHADGERLIRPLRLRDDQIDDLVAFLETLTSGPVNALPALADPCS
jgi:cytochrome c peroxidase